MARKRINTTALKKTKKDGLMGFCLDNHEKSYGTDMPIWVVGNFNRRFIRCIKFRMGQLCR